MLLRGRKLCAAGAKGERGESELAFARVWAGVIQKPNPRWERGEVGEWAGCCTD